MLSLIISSLTGVKAEDKECLFGREGLNGANADWINLLLDVISVLWFQKDKVKVEELGSSRRLLKQQGGELALARGRIKKAGT